MNSTTNVTLRPRLETPPPPKIEKLSDDLQTLHETLTKEGVDVLGLIQNILGDGNVTVSAASVEAATKKHQELLQLLHLRKTEASALKVAHEIQILETKINNKAAVKIEKAASRLTKSQASEIQQLQASLEAAEAENREKSTFIEEQKAVIKEKDEALRQRNEQIQELVEQQRNLQSKIDEIFNDQDTTEASDRTEKTTDLEMQLATLKAKQQQDVQTFRKDKAPVFKRSFNAKKPQRTRTDENLAELLSTDSAGSDGVLSIEQEAETVESEGIGNVRVKNIATDVETMANFNLISTLKVEIADLKQRLASSNAKCLEDKTEIEYIEELFTSELEETKEKLFVAEDNISSLVGQLSELKTKLAETEEKLRTSEEDNWALQEESRVAIKKSHASVTEFKRRLAASNAQYLDHVRQLEKVETEYKEKLAATVEQLELIKDQNRILLSRNANLEKRDSSSALSISGNSIEFSGQGDDGAALAASKAKIKELEKLLSESEAERQNSSAKLDYLDSFASLEELDDIKEKLYQSEAKVCSLKKELKTLQSQVSVITTLKEDLEKTRAKLKASQQKSQENYQKLKKARAEQIYLKERLTMLNAQRYSNLAGPDNRNNEEPTECNTTTAAALPASLNQTTKLNIQKTSSGSNESTIAGLEKQLAEANAQLQKAAEESAALESGYQSFLEDSLESMKKSENEAAKLKIALQEAQVELDGNKKSFDDLKVRFTEMHNALLSLISECGVNDVTELSNNISLIQKKLRSSNLQEMERKIRDIEIRCGVSDIHEIPAKVAGLNNDTSELKQSLAESNLYIEKTNTKLKNLNNAVSCDKVELQKLQEQLGQTKSFLGEAQTELKVRQKSLDDLNDRLTEQNQILQSLARDGGVADSAELSIKIGSLQKKLLSSSLEEAEGKLRNIENRCGVRDIHELPHKISELEMRLSDAQKQSHTVSDESSRLKNSLDQSAFQSEEANANLKHVGNAVDAGDTEIQKLRSLLNQTVSKKVALEEQIDVLKEQRDKSDALVMELQAAKRNNSSSSIDELRESLRSGDGNLNGSVEGLSLPAPGSRGIRRPSTRLSFRQLSDSISSFSARQSGSSSAQQ